MSGVDLAASGATTATSEGPTAQSNYVPPPPGQPGLPAVPPNPAGQAPAVDLYANFLDDDDLMHLDNPDDDADGDPANGSDADRDYSKPHVKSVVPPGLHYEPIFDFGEDMRHDIKFTMHENLHPTAANLSYLFFPDEMVKEWAEASTNYARSKQPDAPKIQSSDILHFLAIVMYMGIVRLPDKRDYWSTRKLMPSHDVCQAHHMSRTKFLYLYKNFHLIGPEHDEEEEEEGNSGDDYDVDDEDGILADSWYKKVEPFLRHVVNVSQKICKHPSSCLSIDEMMAKFKGRSVQTFRMKGKPIKQGFKFWALCDRSGFVYHMMPCTRVGTKEGDVSKSLADMVKIMGEKLPDAKDKKKKYCVAMDNLFTTSTAIKNLRECGVGVVGTARARRGWPPKEIRDKSPKTSNGIDDTHFNSVYYTHDKDNYLIVRWVDNNVVKMISTVHLPNESVLKIRRKPRITTTNKSNVDLIWKDSHTVEIHIPKVAVISLCTVIVMHTSLLTSFVSQIIDDYNMWMCGVDICDQLIAYYNPQLRHRRNWLPMFMHCVNVSRTNSFLIHKKLSDVPLTHKEFTLQYIESLMNRVDDSYKSRLKRAAEANRSPPVKAKRTRLSHKNPELPSMRFEGEPHEHIAVVPKDKKQNKCKMCSFELLFAKKRNKERIENDMGEALEELPKVRTSTKICGYCSKPTRVYLCEGHFSPYHERPQE